MFVAGGVVTVIMRASIEIRSRYGARQGAARIGWRKCAASGRRRESGARQGINANLSGSGRESRYAG
jgi:hypothetical protein